MRTTILTAPPPELIEGLDKLEGIAALLRCVDADKWGSLGRPSNTALAAMVAGAHNSIVAGVSAVCDLPQATA